MNKIVILDFNTGKVLILPFPEGEDGDAFMDKLHFRREISNPNDCNWMVTKEEIIIQ